MKYHKSFHYHVVTGLHESYPSINFFLNILLQREKNDDSDIFP